jgi:hypothetical protein
MTSMREQATNDNSEMTADEREAHAAFQRVVERRQGSNATFAETEEISLRFGNELCKEAQRRDLERRATQWGDADLEINGTRYRFHADGGATYHGLCGSFWIERATYRQVGVHNGPTVVPLELDAGLLHGATPALAFSLSEGYGQGPSRQQLKALLSAHRAPPSRSTTERIAKALGGEIHDAVSRIEPVVRAKETLPEGVFSIGLGLDRTTAPMEEKLEGAALANHKNRRTKPYIREAPAPVEVNYRMAYVGTVSLLDVDGRAMRTWRYGASAEEGPAAIVDRMMADVRHALSLEEKLKVVLVQDGAREMWGVMAAALENTVGTRGSTWHEAIDRHHLAERLADVLTIAKENETGDSPKVTLKEWNERLEADDDGIDTIHADVIAIRDLTEAESTARKKLDDHITYLKNNNHRMRYASLRKLGLPVGSGPTEGACKSLVMVRAKGCGQRWHSEGLEAVLTLRGLDMSERLAPLFNIFAREKVASIRLAA